MDTVAHIAWTLEDARGRTLRLLGEVCQEELTWRPCDTCNSVGAMAIHIGRVEDVLGARALDLEGQLWKSGGWLAKLGLEEIDWGWGYDKLEASAKPGAQAIIGYLEATQARTKAALKTLAPERLDIEIEMRRSMTVSQWLGFIANEELQHLGQMDYLRGMKKVLGA